jgi:tetratricopeptide (TPR) repeat protein
VADQLGDASGAAALRQEASAIAKSVGSEHFEIADEIQALMANFDPERARAVLARAEAQGPDLALQTELALVASDPNLDDVDKIDRLETLWERASSGNGDDRLQGLIGWALADALVEAGMGDRAASRLRALLDIQPANRNAADRLVKILFEREVWQAVVAVLEDQRKRFEPDHRLLATLGVAYFQAGVMSKAAAALISSRKLHPFEGETGERLKAMLETAIELAGEPLTLVEPQTPQRPVTGEQLEAALREFSAFVSREKRGVFWVKMSDKVPKWTPSPEALAQTLLHTALAALFGADIEVLEERPTGAGRLDMWIRLPGGLEVIVELKMCGGSYSAGYATAGEQQLEHYMAERGVHLGYLLVLDGRIEDGGEPVLSKPAGSKNTIREISVNLSPRVSNRRTKAPG